MKVNWFAWFAVAFLVAGLITVAISYPAYLGFVLVGAAIVFAILTPKE